MSEVPRLASVDSTIALLLKGYSFISERCRRHGTDAFETRVMGERVVCMMGEEAARMFYGGGCFTRRRGIPRPTLTLLQDFGSVAVLDGEAHRHRKQMFMELMTPDAIVQLAGLMAEEWRAAVGGGRTAPKSRSIASCGRSSAVRYVRGQACRWRNAMRAAARCSSPPCSTELDRSGCDRCAVSSLDDAVSAGYAESWKTSERVAQRPLTRVRRT